MFFAGWVGVTIYSTILCFLTYLMSSSCNEIYFCPTIKNLELELEVNLGRKKREQWIDDEKKETKNGRDKMGFCLLFHNLIFLLFLVDHG